jgi:hypothetical protein
VCALRNETPTRGTSIGRIASQAGMLRRRNASRCEHSASVGGVRSQIQGECEYRGCPRVWRRESSACKRTGGASRRRPWRGSAIPVGEMGTGSSRARSMPRIHKHEREGAQLLLPRSTRPSNTRIARFEQAVGGISHCPPAVRALSRDGIECGRSACRQHQLPCVAAEVQRNRSSATEGRIPSGAK